MVNSKTFIDLKLEDFILHKMIGKGAFGKVYLAKLSKNDKIYAIKSIRKDLILEKDSLKNIKNEKEILLLCDHPNLVSMESLFQSEVRLYFVMPYIRGGELYGILA